MKPKNPNHRRLVIGEIRLTCTICSESFITAEEAIGVHACGEPCIDPLDIIKAAKDEAAFDMESAASFPYVLRIERRLIERAL